MKSKNILIIALTFLLISCNVKNDEQKKDKQLIEKITGDWIRIIEKDKNLYEVLAPPLFYHQGMTISNDSIEFYTGFFKAYRDSITDDRMSVYLGNTISYETDHDTIIAKNPETEKKDLKWTFINRKNDTLKLAINDTIIITYKKLHYNIDTLPDFDQIIYSSSGCYGTCQIIDMSLDKKGNILFQGEGYARPLGFYSAKLDYKTKKYIFDKFRKANPLGLLNEYYVGHTDDETISTTYIKDGKIVKTIDDYGMAASNELIWAYIPMAYMYQKIKLNKLPLDEPYYPKLHFFTFKKGNKFLELKKSESFYLWTELKKSKQTEVSFKPTYNITFRRNYTFWGPDPNKARQHQFEITSITSDGRFYKFEFNGQKPITYDLGYDFIHKNFKDNDFKKPDPPFVADL